MKTLGFAEKERPEKLGCGKRACAYHARGSDAVVKITIDERDVTVCHLMRSLDPYPSWAIPVYATYRLPKEKFVIVTAKAEPLPKEWAEPIDTIFEYCADEEQHGPSGLRPRDWDSWRGYPAIKRRILEVGLRKGPRDEGAQLLQRALDRIDKATRAFEKLGLDCSDFIAENWGMWHGEPVLIDFGVERLTEEDGFDLSNVPVYPTVKSIPVLPFG